MSESYDPDLNVIRNRPLSQILNWVSATKNPHRILSVSGPPGIGKSWLMGDICKQLKDSGQLLLLLNLGTVPLLSDDSYPPFFLKEKTNFQNKDVYLNWIGDAITEARNKGGKYMRDCDRSLAPETLLDRMIQDLCEHCKPSLSPILIVDGFEEIGKKEERHWLEAHFFMRFLSRSCTTMILTRRDEWAIHRLRLFPQENLRLEAFSASEGLEQIAKRQAKIAERSPYTQVPEVDAAFSKLCESINEYPKNHPRINAELFEIARDRLTGSAALSLSYEEVRGILKKIAKPADITAQALDRLQQLAESFSGEFSAQELQENLKILLNDASLHELFELGILLESPPRYKLADGIYELARAMARLAR